MLHRHPYELLFRETLSDTHYSTEYVNAADGRKLRTKQTTAVEGLTVPMGQTMDLTAAQTLAVDTTDCSGPWMFRRRGETNVTYTDAVSYHFDGGYITFQPELVQQPLLPVMTYNYVPSYHYYLRDHLGNNRLVISDTGDIEQTNEYYPYGGPWGNASTFQGLQPFKYNGKELDRVHGLDWYDYGARRYDPAFCQFTQMDPLCEQYPHLSPYAYCAGNPVRYVDPDGKDWYDYGARWSTGSGPVPGMTLININTSLGYEAFKQELQVGDVLVWRNSGHGHAAIYVEGDTVVHASAHAYKKVVKAAVIRHFISEYGAYPKIYRLP